MLLEHLTDDPSKCLRSELIPSFGNSTEIYHASTPMPNSLNL